MFFCELLFFTNIALGHFRGGGSLSETGLFQNCWKQFLRSVGGQVLALLVTTFAALLFRLLLHAAKAIWDKNPFEVTFEFSNSKFCISFTLFTKMKGQKILESLRVD